MVCYAAKAVVLESVEYIGQSRTLVCCFVLLKPKPKVTA
jgi:hypothetical protein